MTSQKRITKGKYTEILRVGTSFSQDILRVIILNQCCIFSHEDIPPLSIDNTPYVKRKIVATCQTLVTVVR